MQASMTETTARSANFISTGYRTIKRLADFTLALVVAILLLPLFLLVSVLALLCHGWPIFYFSRRHISPEKTIRVFKFRTMVKDATSPKYRLAERFMRNGYLDIPPNCEVFTSFGRLLERTQLVELPQVFNILFHGMSWIGNRPLPSSNHKLLGDLAGWEKRYDAPCGITGISQVVGKLNLEAKQRIELECLYSQVYLYGNVVKCDIAICIATIKMILFTKTMNFEEARGLLLNCLRT